MIRNVLRVGRDEPSLLTESTWIGKSDISEESVWCRAAREQLRASSGLPMPPSVTPIRRVFSFRSPVFSFRFPVSGFRFPVSARFRFRLTFVRDPSRGPFNVLLSCFSCPFV
jgi:hypothetical protein